MTSSPLPPLGPATAGASGRTPGAGIPRWLTLAAAAGAVAVLWAMATVPHLTGVGRFVIYFLVIAAAAYLRGLAAGLAAAALSVWSLRYYAIHVTGAQPASPQSWLALGLFAAASVALAVWMAAVRAGTGRRRGVERMHALLATVVDTSDDAIFSKDPDGTILSWNGGAERLYGYRPQEAVGRPVAMLVPPERAEEVGIVLDGLRRGQSFRYETVRLRKDGARVDVALTISPLRDESGRVIGSSTVARDITERKRADVQLRQHGELLDLSYDAIFLWDLDGAIVSWNRGAEALYGYSEAEAIGRVTHDLLGTVRPGGSESFSEEIRRTGRWEGELRHRTKDGRELIVDSRHQLIERGDRRLVLEITRDVTARRRAEERQRILAEISAVLARSLNVAETLEALARTAVAIVADVCGVHVIRNGTVVRRFAVAPGDPGKADVLRLLEEQYPDNTDAPYGVPHVLRTGEAALYREITAEILAAAAGPGGGELIEAAHRVGWRSAIFVPLTARGRTIGAMGIIRTGSGRPYDEEDLALAEALAQRAALALDNALLHEAEQEARRDAERAAERIAGVQTVTAALSRAATPDEVARVILERGIAALGAAAGAVHLLEESGTTLRMIRGVDYPEEMTRGRPTMPLDAVTPLTQAVKTRRPFFLESADEAKRRYPDVRDVMHPSPGARAIVPMIVRGRVSGALLFVFRAPRTFEAADRDFIESLAGLCAQALERSRLYAQEHHVAATLQRALLPAALPYVPGVTIDAAHRAGSPGADVGGDWYDAFRLPDGRIVVAIGDVIGRGLDAAVAMGQIRQAVRAAALEGHPPSAVLALIGRILPLATAERDMTTAIVGIFDSVRSTFTYATAGHPAPLLASGGLVATLPSGGLPIGFMSRLPAPSWTVDLAPGSLLVMYTDGLIESRRDATAGLAALTRVVEEQARIRPAAPAQAILDHVDVSASVDDIALVTIAVDPAPLDRLELTVPAEPDSLPLVRHALRHLVRDLRLDERRAFALTVAAGEAVNNVIEHAYVVAAGTAALRAWTDGAVLRVEVADRGRWRAARVKNEGGRGLMVMRALADSVEVETTDAGTTVRLAISLEQDASAHSRPGGTADLDRPATMPAAPAFTVPAGADRAALAIADGEFPTQAVDGACLVEVSGAVDMTSAPRLAAAVEAAAAQTAAGPVILSLKSAEYLDSHGVATLLNAATRLRVNRRALYLVVPPGSPLGAILGALDVASLCPVFSSVDAAVGAASHPGEDEPAGGAGAAT